MEAADDGVAGAEFVTVEFATGSLAATTALAVAEEFCPASCADGVAAFLLRKRAAAPKSVPAITTIMAAIFQ